MTRVAACGAAFDKAVALLDLEAVADRPDLVLVDITDPASIARASTIDPEIPRVAVGLPDHMAVLRALGVRLAVAPSADPAAIGPLIAAALPAIPRRGTRTIVVTGVAGGTGRTLLVANLATRLAARASVLVLDATGAGAAGWWLGLAPGGWPDLEDLANELTGEHLAVVAAEVGKIRLVGGRSAPPSVDLVVAAARAGSALADIILVDAPSAHDARTRALGDLADRLLVVTPDDPSSPPTLEWLGDDARTWLIGARCRSERIAGHPVMRALPDDPASVRSAARGPSTMGGALGRAYDDITELLEMDIE